MNATILRNYAEYLSFRSFYTGHPIDQQRLPHVEDADEMVDVIKQCISSAIEPAILLSGGMDSAVLAPFMPKGTTAYTIFHGKLEKNELDLAASYCRKFSLNHVPVEIAPTDYLGVIDELAERKGMPLSPAEPIFYLAARRAQDDGHESVITGCGADAKFGGFPSMRVNIAASRYERKLQRRYLSPEVVLQVSTDIQHVLDAFNYTNKKGNLVVSSRAFLRDVGFERFAFDNAIGHADCTHVAPFSKAVVRFDHQTNRERPKYFISDLYARIYGHEPPRKLGLQKPTFLLADYQPRARIFAPRIDMDSLSYPKKLLIYSLERFHLRRYGDVGLEALASHEGSKN